MFRYRIHFGKLGALRWTGHLDLQTTFERTFRRARLPLMQTQGFHPRPKLQFASTLPLGCTSEAELCDAWLERPLAKEGLHTTLKEHSPPGLEVYGVEHVAAEAAALQSALRSAHYHVCVEGDLLEAEERTRVLLTAEIIERVTHKGRKYNLRPLIERLSIDRTHQRWEMQLSAYEGAIGRASEVVAAMGYDPLTTAIHRTRLILA